MPGMSIGELCEIFGNYERLAEPGIFIWDSMGIIMVSHDKSGRDSAPVSGIMINWNIELSGFITDEDLKWLKNRCPRQYFTGKMIVGGAVLGRGMHIDDFLKKTNLKFNNNPFPLLYYCHLHDWDYTKAPIHRRANSLWRKNGRSVWHTLQPLGTGRNQTLCTISSKVIRMRASFVSLC